jgi:hypothetical protein
MSVEAKLADVSNNVVNSIKDATQTVYNDASSVVKDTTLNPIPALIISTLIAVILTIILLIAVVNIPNNQAIILLVGVFLISGFTYVAYGKLLEITFMVQNPGIAGTAYGVSLGRNAWDGNLQFGKLGF